MSRGKPRTLYTFKVQQSQLSGENHVASCHYLGMTGPLVISKQRFALDNLGGCVYNLQNYAGATREDGIFSFYFILFFFFSNVLRWDRQLDGHGMLAFACQKEQQTRINRRAYFKRTPIAKKKKTRVYGASGSGHPTPVTWTRLIYYWPDPMETKTKHFLCRIFR